MILSRTLSLYIFPVTNLHKVDCNLHEVLKTLKIATWNVNSIRTRQQIVIDWLQQNPVDVLCLQETKVQDVQFPRSPFAELGYHIYISGQKSYNGVAIFS